MPSLLLPLIFLFCSCLQLRLCCIITQPTSAAGDHRLQVKSCLINSTNFFSLRLYDRKQPQQQQQKNQKQQQQQEEKKKKKKKKQQQQKKKKKMMMFLGSEAGRSKDPVVSLGQLTTAYYMQTKIGTPAMEVLLLIDTASELTWLQCTACSNCSPTKLPPFNSDISSSFISEYCNASVCSNINNLGFHSACNNSTSFCTFQVEYLDGSEAYGTIGREIFSLESVDGSISRFRNMIFGCASQDLQRPVVFSSGTLGLNRGNYSFPSQLGHRNDHSGTFSYCFPNRAQHLNSAGLIIFGDSGMSQHLQYTPLQEQPALATILDFYYVDLVGISIDDELLAIPDSAFTIDSLNGYGGTYFDSGTTVSFLVEPAHTALAEAFGKRVAHHLNRTSEAEFQKDLCYDIPSPSPSLSSPSPSSLPKAPQVTLHFKNNAKLVLRETSLWLPLGSGKNKLTYCLAFMNAGSVAEGGVNVIGNYHQQDYLIEHDLKRSRIGFAPANCVMD